MPISSVTEGIKNRTSIPFFFVWFVSGKRFENNAITGDTNEAQTLKTRFAALNVCLN